MALPDRITLSSISEGAAEELFFQAMQDVAANLYDPNTDWKAGREIILRFKFGIDEKRELGEVDIRCTTKLAGVKGVRRPIYLGKKLGVPTMVEAPSQPELFTNPDPKLMIAPKEGTQA